MATNAKSRTGQMRLFGQDTGKELCSTLKYTTPDLPAQVFSFDQRLAYYERLLETAQDDDAWVEAFLGWIEVHRLKYGGEL